MSRKEKIHKQFKSIAYEVLEHINEMESNYEGRWMPAVDIKNELDLNFDCYPISNNTQGKRGWVFSAIMRALEEENRVEFRKSGPRSFYRVLVR